MGNPPSQRRISGYLDLRTSPSVDGSHLIDQRKQITELNGVVKKLGSYCKQQKFGSLEVTVCFLMKVWKLLSSAKTNVTIWLVVTGTVLFSHSVGNVIIPIDELTFFQRGRLKPTRYGTLPWKLYSSPSMLGEKKHRRFALSHQALVCEHDKCIFDRDG